MLIKVTLSSLIRKLHYHFSFQFLPFLGAFQFLPNTLTLRPESLIETNFRKKPRVQSFIIYSRDIGLSIIFFFFSILT